VLVKVGRLIFFVLFLSRIAFGNCLKCHKFKEQPFGHSPFVNHNCGACHLGEKNEESQKEHVRWIKTIECYKGLNCLRLGRNGFLGSMFYVEVPSLGVSQIVDVSNPPYLKVKLSPSKVKIFLCSLERGVFLIARMCVETDSPVVVDADCEGVCCGNDGIYRTYNVLELDFPIKKRGSRCIFVIKDMAGNSLKRDEEFVFSSYSSLEPDTAQHFRILTGVADSQDRFLCFKTDGYVECKLGIVEETLSSILRKVKNHPPIVAIFESSIKRCYKCHPKSMLGVSHPVGIPLGENMKKQPGIRLVNGKVTCASCHNPHSSRYPYLLRQKQQELCIGCHGEKYK